MLLSVETKIFNIQRKYLTPICIKWVPYDPSTTLLVISSTRKIPEYSNSMKSSIFMKENI